MSNFRNESLNNNEKEMNGFYSTVSIKKSFYGQ